MKRTAWLPILLLSTSTTFAAEPSFLQRDKIDLRAVLPEPPQAGSAALKSDLAALHRIEAHRSEADAERARYDENNPTVFLFATVLGPNFTEAQLPLTAAFFKRVRDDESAFGDGAKDLFKRPRPFEVDTTLHPVCRTKDIGTSYPSGYMLRGVLYARLLSEALPEKKAAIVKRGDDFANNRLVCGSHYPSDMVGSRALALRMAELLLASPEFRAAFEPVRAEMRHALGLA
ncbi:acid phosphatase [Roseiterribacter gracilis]|uniref:Acid phosphatase n=1 Tax=Roseiterribacter gracilis TaxID=2812848 RepID=A0A8S8XFR5_9PROT|nr:acid phosphatase [Rhodospirillales bacterium TMPK1]